MSIRKVSCLSCIVAVLLVLAMPALALDVTYKVLNGSCKLEPTTYAMSEASNLLLAPPAPEVDCMIMKDVWNKETNTRNVNQVCQLKSSTGRVIAEMVHAEGYYTVAEDGGIVGYFVMVVPSQGCDATVRVEATP